MGVVVMTGSLLGMSGIDLVFRNFLETRVEVVDVAVGGRTGGGGTVFLANTGGKKCMLSRDRRFVRGECDASLDVFD